MDPKLSLNYTISFNTIDSKVERLQIKNHIDKFQLDIKRKDNKYQITGLTTTLNKVNNIKDISGAKYISDINCTYEEYFNRPEAPIILNRESICNYIIKQSDCFYFIILVNEKIIKLRFDINTVLVYYPKSNILYVYYCTSDNDSYKNTKIFDHYNEKYIFTENNIICDIFENPRRKSRTIIDHSNDYHHEEYKFDSCYYISNPFFNKCANNGNIYFLGDTFEEVSINGENKIGARSNSHIIKDLKLHYFIFDEITSYDEIEFPIYYNPLFPNNKLLTEYFKISKFIFLEKTYKGINCIGGKMQLDIDVFDYTQQKHI